MLLFLPRQHSLWRGWAIGFLALALLVTTRAPAQSIITGQITDSLRAALPGVSVFLTARGSAAGLVYTVSDATGRYQLSPPAGVPDTLQLNLRLLGFAPLMRPVVLAGRNRLELNLVLREAVTRLNEVVVRAQRRGIRYNDTTTYQAQQYTTGTERTLEDVLKNVPGFVVSPEGQISYKGTPISGVYVEGDNLTGADYQRISRNLNATLVDKIQPVEHFVENKLLGGLVRSETTVLNITIPADRKKPLFGNVAADAALPNYRNASVNLFSYRKRSKAFFISTHNNVGTTKDPIAESLTTRASASSLRQEVQPVRALLAPPSMRASDFQPELSTLNNETTGGLIHVVKPDSGHWKLLTDFSLYTNQLHQTRRASTSYLLGDADFLRLGELDRARQTTTSARLRNNFFATLGKKTNFTYENRLSLLRNDFCDTLGLTTQVPQATSLETIRQCIAYRPVQFGQNAVLTNRFSETEALQTQVVHTYDQLPAQLDIESDSPTRQVAYLGQATNGPLRQTGRTWQHALSADTEYFRTARWVNYSAVLGFDYAATRLETELLPVVAADIPLQTQYANRLSVIRGRLYGQIKFDKTQGRLNINGSLGTTRLQLAVHDQKTRTAQEFSYPTGRVTARYALKPSAYVELGYTFEQNFSSPDDLLPQPMLVDFRSFARGTAQVLVQPEHRLNLSFDQRNYTTLTEIQASIQVSRRAADLGQRLQIDELLSRSALFVGPATQAATAQLRAAQFISPLSTRIQVESAGTYAESYNQFNSSGLRLNRLALFRSRLQLGTAFDIPVNLFVGATLTTNVLTSQIGGGEIVTSHNSRFQSDCQVVVRLKHLTATLRADQLHVNQNNYFFLGADAKYAPVKGRLTYFLTLKNLLDTRTSTEVIFTNLVTRTTSYELLPRLIMPGISCRF